MSISRFRILAVSEMIDVDVLIAPLMSSSKSTESRNAVAVAPEPPPPEIVTSGAVVYPEPGLLTAIEVTLPLKVKADARAVTPPGVVGGAIVTSGLTVNPKPAVSISILLTLCPVLLIPTRGN